MVNITNKVSGFNIELSNQILSKMLNGWYIVLTLNSSWAKAKLWIQVVSGQNVYIYHIQTIHILNLHNKHLKLNN